ncbi:MAG: hypothetical protein LCH30_07910 [Proteobacteria bacterium]|nr:hypothetical protein [Pseudomonadota bacterium]
MTKSDLHLHLNGSLSHQYLKETAKRNGCGHLYKQFIALNKKYLQFCAQIAEPKSENDSKELIDMVWRQFDLIHKIIQSPLDIELAVIDVVESQSAPKYQEIRTTPKALGNHSREAYINAFELGLLKANAKQKEKEKKKRKIAYGILSLDRVNHTLADAKKFIEHIKTSPNKVLVGIDISGNPLKDRKLTGNALIEVIRLCLDEQIGLAIHMGEVKPEELEVEERDNDAILTTLEQWAAVQPEQKENPFFGKIRLGHCIYLTNTQKERIKKLNIPIEVCPSCHEKFSWHEKSKPHPVQSIYDEDGPIVLGTDDRALFQPPEETIKDEYKRACGFFGGSLSYEDLKERQGLYYFGKTTDSTENGYDLADNQCIMSNP